MTGSEDKNLKSFLQKYQPEPPVQSRGEESKVFRAIESEMSGEKKLGDGFSETVLVNAARSRGLFESWLGAAGFVAATFFATVITTKTVSQSPRHNSALVLSAQPEPIMALDEIWEVSEEDSPSLDIGQDWLELAIGY